MIPIVLWWLSALMPLAGAQAAAQKSLDDCSLVSNENGAVSFRCLGGPEVRVQPVTAEIIRVRVSSDGKFPESLPIR
jgi:hypothetical protein